jgi:hypothetical protein
MRLLSLSLTWFDARALVDFQIAAIQFDKLGNALIQVRAAECSVVVVDVGAMCVLSHLRRRGGCVQRDTVQMQTRSKPKRRLLCW